KIPMNGIMPRPMNVSILIYLPYLSNTMATTETSSVTERSSEINYKFCMSSFCDALLTHYSHADTDSLEDHVGHQCVPDHSTQTVYVWFHALLAYLSGIGYPETGNTWPLDVQVGLHGGRCIRSPYLLLKLAQVPRPATHL
ncbi:hypothetical protein EDD15DRAFT_2247380, partial [Pisolithus albus]